MNWCQLCGLETDLQPIYPDGESYCRACTRDLEKVQPLVRPPPRAIADPVFLGLRGLVAVMTLLLRS